MSGQSDYYPALAATREALDDPWLLHWLGSQDVLDVDAATARAAAAIHALRAALPECEAALQAEVEQLRGKVREQAASLADRSLADPTHADVDWWAAANERLKAELEQMRGERDRAIFVGKTNDDSYAQMRAHYDKRLAAAEAAVRAGGNAADALRTLFAELDDYSIRLTDERLDDLHSAIISAAREALAVLEPEEQAYIEVLGDSLAQADADLKAGNVRSLTEILEDPAASLHTEATQQEGSGE